MSATPGVTGIGQIAVSVQDVDRAVRFYQDVLGLPLLFQFPGMAFFDCNGVRLYLTRPNPPELSQTSILYFRVPDIQAAAAALLARGVDFQQPPNAVHRDAHHELWLAFFKDSEGNQMALMAEVPLAEAR